MGIRSFIKKTVKDNTNVKGWAAWDTIKANAQTIGSFVNDLKAEPSDQPPVQSTFEAVIKHYGLTENDIAAQMRSHFRVALVCALLGLGAVGWGVYILLSAMFLSSLMSFSLAVLMFAYAFREHFFYFEMKQRRLNCTVKEWFFSFVRK